MNKTHLPTNKIYKRELLRRDPRAKVLCGKKNVILEGLLCLDEFDVTILLDIEYIQSQECLYNAALVENTRRRSYLTKGHRAQTQQILIVYVFWRLC